eukprot:TRINITY_DN13116_c0_g1_i1.p1 TRINITY_DN13116_c0_g1~~TRINITY_DN13116_c0_g1_i1.p1  ORF type:complete len:337 (+),score=78.56 TRINITY_DN13116_c0_g1_i1:119-1129(+)
MCIRDRSRPSVMASIVRSCWLAVLVATLALTSAEFSANPDLSPLYTAGSFSKADHTVRVQVMAAAFTTNRFGARVPQLKPDEDAPNPLLHLKYMTLRGLADLPAMIMECGGLPYRATYYSRVDFQEAKGSLEFGRLPVLESGGRSLSQSSTIVRYLADRAGLAGGTEAERARVDELFETVKDLFVAHGTWGKAFDVETLRAGPVGGESMLHFRETSNRGEHTAFQKAAVALKTFEDVLVASGTGFLVGANLTYVDLALWQKLQDLGQPDNLGQGWADRLGMPQLGSFAGRLYSKQERLAGFVSSGRRMPRIKRVDGDYVFFQDSPIPEPTVPKIDL